VISGLAERYRQIRAGARHSNLEIHPFLDGWRKPMKRIVLILAGTVGVAVFGALVHGVLVAAHLSEPAAATVYGPTARRVWATGAAVLALVGVIIGALALVRSVRGMGNYGRRGAVMALVTGPIASLNGGLVLAVATGGPGSGNGVVGGAAALVLGLIATILGGVVLSRPRRVV